MTQLFSECVNCHATKDQLTPAERHWRYCGTIKAVSIKLRTAVHNELQCCILLNNETFIYISFIILFKKVFGIIQSFFDERMNSLWPYIGSCDQNSRCL